MCARDVRTVLYAKGRGCLSVWPLWVVGNEVSGDGVISGRCEHREFGVGDRRTIVRILDLMGDFDDGVF